jgi:STE24 endopeptidase
LFVAAVAIGAGLRIWLARRQVAHVRAHRDEVPAEFRSSIPLEQHQKAADYTAVRTRLNLAGSLLDLALALAWTLGGALTLLDTGWRGLGLGQLTTGVGVMVSLSIIGAAIELPLSAYGTFAVEARFGFNRTTARTFVLDLGKGLLVALVLGVPLAYAALWLMTSTGRLWWLYLWLLYLAFSLFVTWAYPAVIAPLFNKFSPLENEALRERIKTLLARCGFESRGIFVMDGSARSAHGNAYFTGLGRNKRIVFFDTLIERLGGEEIEAVLAHELGHFRLRHIRKRLVLMAVLSLAGLALLGWLRSQAWFYAGLGVAQPSAHMALLLFMLVAPPFLFLLQPASAALSRRHEFEADEYATQQADGRALVAALVKLYHDNASTLTPDPLHSSFYDSHPPAAARVGALKRLTSSSASSEALSELS